MATREQYELGEGVKCPACQRQGKGSRTKWAGGFLVRVGGNIFEECGYCCTQGHKWIGLRKPDLR